MGLTGDVYCLTCKRALDTYRVKSTGELKYVHTLLDRHLHGEPDHEPIPVPIEETLDVDQYCDFCSLPKPAWIYILKEDIKEKYFQEINWGIRWAACEKCAQFIESKNVIELLTRVLHEWNKSHQEPLPWVAKRSLMRLYEKILYLIDRRVKIELGKDPFGLKK